MKKYIVYLFLFSTWIGIGQELNTYSPVSPTAASLGKFGVFPVNMNLGTTNISIPLYTIKQGDIEIPINLSYNATSGIRVNEEASWVGLGWTLNAGGAIIRNVKGQPGSSTILDLENVEFNAIYDSYFQDVSQGVADSAPDEYLFNYSGNSGKFYYNQELSKYVFIDYKPITISSNDGDFQALLENGQRLNFNDHESVDNWHEHGKPLSYRKFNTASYLTRVTSVNQTDHITFDYDDHSFDKAKEKIGDQISMELAIVNASSFIPLPPQVSRQTGGYKSYEKTLRQINFKAGYVLFDYSMDRTDSQSPKLNHIKVYSTINGVDTLIKQITFNYNYYSRSGGGYDTLNQNLTGPGVRSSLRLTSVDLYENTTAPQSYSFEYNPRELPIRTSSGQDFWGYANTNTGSYMHRHNTIFHSMSDSSKSTAMVPFVAEVGTGDRNADEVAMQSGILTKITYPTGGYTEFEYEANKYNTTIRKPIYNAVSNSYTVGSPDTGCGSSNLATSFTIPQEVLEPKIRFSFLPCQNNQNARNAYAKLNDATYKRKSIPFSEETDNGYSETVNLFTDRTYQLELKELANSIPNYICTGISASVSWKVLDGYEEEEKEILVGGLRIKSITNYDGVDIEFTSKKAYEYDTPRVLIPVAERDYRKVHKVHLEPKFLNIITSYPTYSLNVNGGPAAEYTEVTEYHYDNNDIDNGKIVYEYEPTPAYRIMDIGGDVTGSEFTLFEHPDSYQDFCLTPIGGSLDKTYIPQMPEVGFGNFVNYVTKSWAGGSLKSKKVYKRFGDTYLPLSYIENNYTLVDETELAVNYVHPTGPDGLHTGGSGGYSVCSSANFSYSYNRGFISFGKKLLTSTLETTYDTNGENPITTEKSYTYDHPNYFLTEQKTKNSVGEELITKNYYPDNVTDLSGLTFSQQSAIERLQSDDLHQIATTIQTESLKKEGNTFNKINTNRTLFRDWGGSNVLPEFVQTLKGEVNTINTFEDRVQYSYYPNGKPKELYKANGIPIVYIWGYQNEYPIAKIENVTYNQVQSFILNLVTKSNADNDRTIRYTGNEGKLREDLDRLRTVFPNAMISTYTYDPLIGVTSMTDPRGYTIYYQYDDFNRLEFIKDADGNLISENKYNYKN